VLAVLSHRDLVPAIWLPDPGIREGRELARLRLHLANHKSALKNRIHSTLITFGRPCPVTDRLAGEGRRLLSWLEVPEPWRERPGDRLGLASPSPLTYVISADKGPGMAQAPV
jgi:transposase